MNVWAIVPMKSLRIGKSRLAGMLAEDERSALSLQMFVNVLNAVVPVFGTDHVVIVSRDVIILDLARSLHLHIVCEDQPGDLNAAIRQGAEYAMCRGATGVLSVFGDLPSVNTEDIRRMVEVAGDRECVVAAPDRAGTGTNALFVSPPDAITFCFGPGSFRKHRRAALLRRCNWNVFHCAGLAFDVDRPEDVGAPKSDRPMQGEQANSMVVA